MNRLPLERWSHIRLTFSLAVAVAVALPTGGCKRDEPGSTKPDGTNATGSGLIDEGTRALAAVVASGRQALSAYVGSLGDLNDLLAAVKLPADAGRLADAVPLMAAVASARQLLTKLPQSAQDAVLGEHKEQLSRLASDFGAHVARILASDQLRQLPGVEQLKALKLF